MHTEPRSKTGQGWIIFSGIILILGGLNLFFNGLWALDANRSVESTFRNRLLFSDTNIDVWGWIYVIVGVVVIVAGVAVFGRVQWARLIGMLTAAVAMVVHFFWLVTPYWPSALVGVILYGLVLYGLSVYGEPLRT